MPASGQHASPWLFSLAERQRGRPVSPPFGYDPVRQVAVVSDGDALVPAVELHPSPASKKADIEKGEDQKDRW
jgi:hypothetical protein